MKINLINDYALMTPTNITFRILVNHFLMFHIEKIWHKVKAGYELS